MRRLLTHKHAGTPLGGLIKRVHCPLGEESRIAACVPVQYPVCSGYSASTGEYALLVSARLEYICHWVCPRW